MLFDGEKMGKRRLSVQARLDDMRLLMLLIFALAWMQIDPYQIMI